MPTILKGKQIKRVGIITKRNNDSFVPVIKKLSKYLKKKKVEILFDNNSSEYFKTEEGHKKEKILKKADLIITLGGDGTLLKTARRISLKKVMVLGVNLGNLGFLTETTPDKLTETLDKIFEGKYAIDKRSLLRVTIYRGGQKIETFLALNDAVINQGAFARLIKIDLEADGRKVVNFMADGMIIATPTGSTAHALSAGGPIVHPYLHAFVIAPICPSSLSMRPIVIPDDKQITAVIATQRRDESAIIGLTIDGQDMMILKYGDKIRFRRSQRSLYLVRTQNRYYRVLRSKLNWGEL